MEEEYNINGNKYVLEKEEVSKVESDKDYKSFGDDKDIKEAIKDEALFEVFHE